MIRGTFFCFFTLPIEERIGEWRFAGHATTLGAAFTRLDDFGREMDCFLCKE